MSFNVKFKTKHVCRGREDFCDIYVRGKYAAYKCPQVSGNIEKFKTLELLLSFRDWIFWQLLLSFTLPNWTDPFTQLQRLCNWSPVVLVAVLQLCTVYFWKQPHSPWCSVMHSWPPCATCQAVRSSCFKHILVAMYNHIKITAEKDTVWHVGILD